MQSNAQTRQEGEFVASSRGEVYYWVGCDGWRSLARENLLWFASPDEAEAAGYRPSTSRGCAPQLATAPIVASIGGTAECVVARIVDGDTFLCEGGSWIRLLLVDAEETGQSAFADSARVLLEELIPPGRTVTLRFDVDVEDRYDRLLAYVYAEDVFVNRALAWAGLAHLAVYQPNVGRIDEIRAAVDSARVEKRGVWGSSAFECTPADFRAGACR